VGFWSRCTAMPRTSPLPIHLSVAEAAELRRRSTKYTLPYFQVQRAKMILMAAEGWENNEIAARLGTRREVPCWDARSASWDASPKLCIY
jgi:hypothetical protein